MRKILVSVFDTERTAFEGLEALKDLHRDGDITVYATAVITKDANGVSAVKESDDRGPVGTAVGVVGGALVGMLAGPVGAAVGAYVGGMGGLAYDLFSVGVGSDFISEASAQLTPGKSAVVADIDETWVTPVETRIGDLGGVTFRKVPDEVIDEQMTREATQAKAELEGLRAEFRETTGAARAKVEAAIDRQRQKLDALDARIEKEIDEQQADFNGRLTTLQTQQTRVRGDKKASIGARIADLKARFAERKAKLQHSRELTKEAHELTKEAVLP
jgi:uncharacterized membrane protein